jgi:hypothetical protein
VLAGAAALAQLPGLGSFFAPQDFITFLVPLEDDHSLHSYLLDGWAWTVDGEKVGFFRPLTSLTYLAEYGLWGGRPALFRVTSLLMHAVACLLLGRILTRMRGRSGTGWTAAVLFAVHPGAVPAIWMVNCRGDMLAAVMVLAGMLSVVGMLERPYGRGRALLPGLFALLAVAAKESGLAALVVLPATWLLWPDGTRDRRGGVVLGLSLAAVAAVFVGSRLLVFEGGMGGYGAVNAVPVMLRRLPVLAWQSLGALLPWPWVRAAAIAAAAAAAVWTALREGRLARIMVLMVVCWAAMGFQTIVAKPDVHYMYAPSAIVALAAALFVSRVTCRWGRWARICAVAVLALGWTVMSRHVVGSMMRELSPMEAVYSQTVDNLDTLRDAGRIAVVVAPEERGTTAYSLKELRLYLQYLVDGEEPRVVYVPSADAPAVESADLLVDWHDGRMRTAGPDG